MPEQQRNPSRPYPRHRGTPSGGRRKRQRRELLTGLGDLSMLLLSATGGNMVLLAVATSRPVLEFLLRAFGVELAGACFFVMALTYNCWLWARGPRIVRTIRGGLLAHLGRGR